MSNSARPSHYLRPAETLLIVPPFASLHRPALGVHLLQACARARGHRVSVLYANMLLAAKIGEELYEAICRAPTHALLGERYFAAAAYESPAALARLQKPEFAERLKSAQVSIDLQQLAEHAATASEWATGLATELAALDHRIIGASTTFEQTASSLALLRALKRLRPALITILGGANCEGTMATGLAALAPFVDCVFSGESEQSFLAFLEARRSDEPLGARVVYGEPCRDLDALPAPDYDEYYEQLELLLPNSNIKRQGGIWLPYESSRGCWWGEKHHCTFCGLNGLGMSFREKSADKVLADLRSLTARYETTQIGMVDNIMPHRYYASLLPNLARELPGIQLFYEQKSNLTFERVGLLHKAGVVSIQPGIEALATPLLQLMDKGVTAAQNLAMLRYVRMYEIIPRWNLLYGFPGDRRKWYEETLALLPLIQHLVPPSGLCKLSIDRFSPYYERAPQYGITGLLPITAYAEVLPATAEPALIAYHFQGEYESESLADPTLSTELRSAVDSWRDRWNSATGPAPVLELVAIGEDHYLLADTRGLPEVPMFEILDRPKAQAALFGEAGRHEEASAWALARQVCCVLDGKLTPLATAPPALYAKLAAALSTPEQPPATRPPARVPLHQIRTRPQPALCRK